MRSAVWKTNYCRQSRQIGKHFFAGKTNWNNFHFYSLKSDWILWPNFEIRFLWPTTIKIITRSTTTTTTTKTTTCTTTSTTTKTTTTFLGCDSIELNLVVGILNQCKIYKTMKIYERYQPPELFTQCQKFDFDPLHLQISWLSSKCPSKGTWEMVSQCP